MLDQLLAIRAFARVTDTGSFTRAADSLNMPVSTVSKLVKSLETHLGVRLLLRTTRRVTPTPEGREYYENTARILRDIEETDSALSLAGQRPRGQLRVDIGASTARDVLIPALPDFMARYPEITLDLGVADRQVDLISGNVDCVIRGGPMNDSSLIARHIGDAVMITCATPGYLQQYGIPATPQNLNGEHRLIGYLSSLTGRVFPFRFLCEGELTELKIQRSLGINESNAHLAAAQAGLGIVQTFTYSVKSALQQGTMVEVLSDWRPPRYPFHVVYPQNRHVTHRLRVFIDWLSEVFPVLLSGETAGKEVTGPAGGKPSV